MNDCLLTDPNAPNSFRARLLCVLSIGAMSLPGTLVAAQSTEPAPVVDEETDTASAEPDDEARSDARKRILDQHASGLWSISHLIALPQIQSELELTPEQARDINKRIDDIRRDSRTMFRGVRNLSPEEQAQRLPELRAKLEAEMAPRRAALQDLLTPEQRSQLLGKSMQMRGVSSLLDPHVMEFLGLSEEQKNELLDLAIDLERSLTSTVKSREIEPNRIGDRLRGLRSRTEAKLLEVLTEAQRQRFDEILQAGNTDRRVELGPTPILPPREGASPATP